MDAFPHSGHAIMTQEKGEGRKYSRVIHSSRHMLFHRSPLSGATHTFLPALPHHPKEISRAKDSEGKKPAPK